MPLIDQVQKDMVAAMKSKARGAAQRASHDQSRAHEAKVDSPKPLDEAAEMQILKSLIKQRIDAAEMFRKAGPRRAGGQRGGREGADRKLPARRRAGEEEIEAAIAAAMAETGATSLKQMGVVMKAAQARLTGKTVDGKALSEKVRARLS